MIRSLGHLLLASIFISGGANTIINPDPRATKVAAAGIPFEKPATILNSATMVVAGTALALGFAPKLAAALLAATLIPTTFVGHPFWKEESAAGRANQRTHFIKNLGLLGGLLIVLLEKDE